MTTNITKPMLLFAIVLLAFATWINEIAIADTMFIFAAFSIGGVWARQAQAETDIG